MTYMGDNFNNTNCGLLSGPLSGPEQGLIIHGPSTRPSLVSVNEVLRDHGSTLLSLIVHGCFTGQLQAWVLQQVPYGPQCVKYFLPVWSFVEKVCPTLVWSRCLRRSARWDPLRTKHYKKASQNGWNCALKTSRILLESKGQERVFQAR